jgi:hypothetical protein
MSGKQILALKPPTARRAVVDLLSIDFTRLFIIEENSVATSSPFVVRRGYKALIVTFITMPE